MPHQISERRNAEPLLATALAKEADFRISLEIAGAMARIHAPSGIAFLLDTGITHESPDMRMESVLILSELKSADSAKALYKIATDPRFAGSELKQAAVWGLGRRGSADYTKLIEFITDDDDDVALHGICGLSADAEGVAASLIASLIVADARKAAALSAALEQIGTASVLRQLIEALRAKPDNKWLIITIARMPPDLVRSALHGHSALSLVEPLLTFKSQSENWIAKEDIAQGFVFLKKQVM